MKSRSTGVMLLALATALAGCSKYAITDPTSGTVYYTDGYDKSRKSGTVSFTDKRDGTEVTLQQHEIKKISGSEYKDGLKSERRPTAAGLDENE